MRIGPRAGSFLREQPGTHGSAPVLTHGAPLPGHSLEKLPALGFRELYQVLLWERYLRKLLILNDMTIKKQLCQCDKVALF